MFSFSEGRELGGRSGFRKRLMTERCARDLVLTETQPDCGALGSIQSLRVERNENRFLLIGGGSGEIAVFDQEGIDGGGEGAKALVVVPRGDGKTRHSKGVCVADWYCNDSGVFNVGSYDGSVGVWDSNVMECAHFYRVSDCVNVIASGVFAATSPLVAVGTKSDQLRLLDVRQEANTHTLVGHTEQVNVLAWSNWSPHVLVSGDIEGTLFVWDLRKPVPIAEIGSSIAPSVIGPMGRTGAAGPEPRKKRHRFQTLSSLDRKVEEIVQSSYGIVRKTGAPAAHSGPVGSLMFSPKGAYIYSFSLGVKSSRLKTWDAQNYQLVSSVSVEGAMRRHPFMRFDMCCNEQPFDRSHRVFSALFGNVQSIYPETGAHTSWPSGHVTGGLASMQHNKRRELFYSAGSDGMFRVWQYGSLAPVREEEADDWDLQAMQ